MTTYVIQLLAGLGSAAILFLVASGLTLIFGALRIVQFAHGSVYMIGAFLTTTLAFQLGGGDSSWGFWLTLLVTGVFVAALGALAEVTVFRRIYSQPFLTQFLVTFAFVLIIGGAVRATWGTTPRIVETPSFADGSIAVLDGRFPVYLIFLMAFALLVAVLLWWVLYGTKLGRMIRAAVSDSELLALSGVNVAVLFTGVFALGSFLAGVAGAAVTPIAGRVARYRHRHHPEGVHHRCDRRAWQHPRRAAWVDPGRCRRGVRHPLGSSGLSGDRLCRARDRARTAAAGHFRKRSPLRTRRISTARRAYQRLVTVPGRCARFSRRCRARICRCRGPALRAQSFHRLRTRASTVLSGF